MLDDVIVATSTLPEDDVIEWSCDRLGVACVRGSPTDVRSRYVRAALESNAEVVVRVTADNPLTEPRFIDLLVRHLLAAPERDYCVMDPKLVAHGTSSEVFRTAAFLETAARDDSAYAREHVTPCLRTQRTIHLVAPPDELRLSDFNVSIDTLDDYLHVARIFARYRGDPGLLPWLVADTNRARAARAGMPAREAELSA
jgi:spore coat polysaccharide biosynthesis protein SpsF